ncbi:hypothetical protein E2320_007329, partial [Naja naja]
MAPEEPPAKPAPGDKIDPEQRPIMKIPTKYWWIMISIAAGVLIVILATSVQTWSGMKRSSIMRMKFISSKLNESAWIGLMDENMEGHRVWLDGSRLIT